MKRVLRGGETVADRETFCLSAFAGHPSVVQLNGAGAVNLTTGDPFIVMELVDGAATLRSRLKRPLTEDETRAYMLPLLRVAAEAHAAGITHGDISPDNILVGPGTARIKLAGFGCATTERPSEDCLGALPYRAPELVTAIGLANGPRADMWSMGCVMFELLTGAPLFTPDTPDDLADEAEWLHDAFVEPDDALDVRNLRDLSKPGRDLLVGLLSFDQDERPTAADALEHRWFTQTPKQRRATKRRSRRAMLRRTMRWKAYEEAMPACPCC
ncbi:hypothetical protein EJB05_21719, partial [Eragrostis curvula]